jgi:hypothetical protein
LRQQHQPTVIPAAQAMQSLGLNWDEL